MKTFTFKCNKFEQNHKLRLFAENKIQKIYVKDCRILAEVECEIYTRYLDLFKFYV